MLVIALVLALIGLAALVFAVVTSNVLVAWVCIGASVLGVLLLIVDALRERRRREPGGEAPEVPQALEAETPEAETPEAETPEAETPEAEADHPDEAPEENADEGEGAGEPEEATEVPEDRSAAELAE